MSSPSSADYWIAKLHMQPHPEGGYFAETYRSAGQIPAEALPTTYSGPRSFGTGIYFLLTAQNFSSLHRIESDEMWHFYAGDPLTVYTLSPEGVRRDILLGPDPEQQQVFQAVVPGGHWFGAQLAQAMNGFTLVGCTVAPGFDFAGFELAKRDTLSELFPQHRALIAQLTRQ